MQAYCTWPWTMGPDYRVDHAWESEFALILYVQQLLAMHMY